MHNRKFNPYKWYRIACLHFHRHLRASPELAHTAAYVATIQHWNKCHFPTARNMPPFAQNVDAYYVYEQAFSYSVAKRLSKRARRVNLRDMRLRDQIDTLFSIMAVS